MNQHEPGSWTDIDNFRAKTVEHFSHQENFTFDNGQTINMTRVPCIKSCFLGHKITLDEKLSH